MIASRSLPELRSHEAVAGRWYWQTISRLQLSFVAGFRRTVPTHWWTAGTRTSPPSGFKSSRKAATPFHALLNYAYAILETEATITLHAHGFDPGLGILHTDKRYRGSLALDLMEPVRPIVDGKVLELVASHAFARGDVYETREGVCRIGPSLGRRLAAWAPAFREPLREDARLLTDLLTGGQTSPPARERNAVIAGKGGKRRVAPRSS